MSYQPFTGKVSPTACLGGRTVRPLCSCCGGSDGIRRAWRKFNRHGERLTKGKKERNKDKHLTKERN